MYYVIILMRALLQRVKKASVAIDGKIVGQIGPGLLIFLGVKNGNSATDVDFLASKCVNLRIFTDEDGKFNLSALDVNAEILVVSQFTLYGDCRKGRRPSFIDAAPPPVSIPLYKAFVDAIRTSGLRVETGEFGADMEVSLINDGPVTIIAESKNP